MKIHKNLPPGGILVFLTGKKEIQYLEKRLKIDLENKDKKKEHIDDDDDEDFF
jgi:ATP-dependent RNA helicase DHX37/DHR1